MFSKMVMFAASLASRGLSSKKIDEKTKQLRVLSCFGHDSISSCPYLKKSKNNVNHYCDKCGCGDHKHTWLIKDSVNYSKLDYPRLNCPVQMPGFSNYDPNFYNDDIRERKKQIENFDPQNLQFIQITIGNNPLKEKLAEEINKIIQDS